MAKLLRMCPVSREASLPGLSLYFEKKIKPIPFTPAFTLALTFILTLDPTFTLTSHFDPNPQLHPHLHPHLHPYPHPNQVWFG